jgi:hypothetical protein
MFVNNKMRYFWALMLCLVASITTSAQHQNPMFYTEIQLRHKPYTLQSITEEIQRQTGISFSFNADKISPNTKIKLKGDKLTVAIILGTLQKRTGIGYKVISQNHIIYTESARQQKGVTKPKKLKYYAKKSSGNTTGKSVTERPTTPIKSYNSNIKTLTDTEEGNNIVFVGDSSIVSAYYFGAGYGGGGKNETETEEEEASAFPDNEWDDMPNRNAARNNVLKREDVLNFFKENTLFAAGIAVDETYYCNPSLRIGFDFLYGTVSYNLGSPNTWRFGLGTSVKLNDNWQLHFNISSGKPISNNYDIVKFDTMPGIDTFPVQPPVITEAHTPLAVSSKLTRYGISTSYNLGKGFLLEGGVVLNHLKTNYYSNSNPVSLSDILPFGMDADSKYYGIKPPYVIGNSFTANKSSNTKIWIGFQITLLYRLNFLGN